VDKAVARALQLKARGDSLRGAASKEKVAYASVNKAWKALEGDTNGPAWQAFVTSLPPLPPPPAAAPVASPASTPAQAVEESPLGQRLKRKADRFGDAVPYGKHGSWGMYREGVKEMSTKIAAGRLTPAEAHERLEAEGVYASASVLAKKARVAPGKSPVKAGGACKLDYDLKKEVHEEIAVLRAHDLPVTKDMVRAMVLSRLTDEQLETLFPKGITNDVYYRFLDSFDLNTEETKPLESTRDLWLTSTVRFFESTFAFALAFCCSSHSLPPDPPLPG